MSSSTQRKRRTTGTPLVSSPSMKTSKMAQSNRATNSSRAANRAAASNRAARDTTAANTTANGAAHINSMSNDEPDLPTETIDVMDNRTENSVVVVDLTCEGSESAVVDLTNNDSVLVIDEGVQQSRGRNAESYVVSSDEDDVTPNVISAAVMSSYHKSRSTPGTISCPVCLDTYTEIVDSGRLVVSTKCGHVFCSQCLRDALSSSHTCPTCRKRLTNRQYHPLYV